MSRRPRKQPIPSPKANAALEALKARADLVLALMAPSHEIVAAAKSLGVDLCVLMNDPSCESASAMRRRITRMSDAHAKIEALLAPAQGGVQ